MYFKEIRKTEHFELYHKGTIAWSDVVRLIYIIKNKRKKGKKIEIENERFYILCKIENNILYVINVKTK